MAEPRQQAEFPTRTSETAGHRQPYDLRHTFGTAVCAATGGLHATQQLMGHKSQAMTDRYTLAAVPERLQVDVGQVEDRQVVAVLDPSL